MRSYLETLVHRSVGRSARLSVGKLFGRPPSCSVCLQLVSFELFEFLAIFDFIGEMLVLFAIVVLSCVFACCFCVSFSGSGGFGAGHFAGSTWDFYAFDMYHAKCSVKLTASRSSCL